MTDLFPDRLPEQPSETRRDRRRRDRRRGERRKNAISFLVMIGALILLIGGAWFFIKPLIAGMVFSEPNDFPGPGEGATEVVVAEGDTGSRIGQTLLEAGVVKTTDAFNTAFDANPNAQTIQPGTYELPTEMKAADAVAALLDSSYRIDVRITIPEGWTAKQVYARVADTLDVSSDDVEEAAATVGETLPSDADGDLEGWLAPGTYEARPEDDVETVLTQMVERTKAFLADHDVSEKDQQEVLNKASIVEKEVPSAEYRVQVARVLENRLAGCSGDKSIGMDTTLVYAFGMQYSEIPSDERDESPYNTRLNPGLPPTPIGSPSKESIEAVLDPAEGDWCYFVTVNLETKETKFTDDYDKHLDNQAEYREYLEELRSNGDDED